MLTNLPEILDIPEKLLPMIENFDNYRYALLEGGRGGGKSQSIVRFILFLSEKYKLRVVCAREQQVNIGESVYSIFVDLINKYQLAFDVQSTKIVSRSTGSTIHFRGLNEKGRFNIQGLENVTLLFCDEAQALTQRTIDVLIPTIRRDDAKVFFSMNRHVYDDPVYKTFINRKDCLHLSINYFENKHCTAALINEANECKKLNEKDYRHIWLGEALDQSEDALFSLKEIQLAREKSHLLSPGYGIRVAGFDIARYGDDKCAVVVFQQMGALHWEEVYVDEWDHRDLNYTTGRILMITNEQNIDMAAIDEDGMGAGPFDTLTKGRKLEYFVGFRNLALNHENNKSFGNIRTLNAYKMKDIIFKEHLSIKNPKLIEELLTIKYEFDHYQRRILISKDRMRKDGIKSPNLADAAIMAVSLIGNVKEKQDSQYSHSPNASSSNDSLFKIAGIR